MFSKAKDLYKEQFNMKKVSPNIPNQYAQFLSKIAVS